MLIRINKPSNQTIRWSEVQSGEVVFCTTGYTGDREKNGYFLKTSNRAGVQLYTGTLISEEIMAADQYAYKPVVAGLVIE